MTEREEVAAKLDEVLEDINMRYCPFEDDVTHKALDAIAEIVKLLDPGHYKSGLRSALASLIEEL